MEEGKAATGAPAGLMPPSLCRSAALASAFLLPALALGCSRGSGHHALVLAGSTSVQPVAELIAEHYELAYPGNPVNVQGGGSTAGVKATQDGAADIGMTSRDLRPGEEGLEPIAIARDAVVLVVHPANRITNLTRAQVRAIYAGEITEWTMLGVEPWSSAPDARDTITVVTREEGSGTRSAFEEGVMGEVDISPRALVQDSTGTVRAIVATDPSAIGYMSLGMITDEVHALAFDGVTANVDTVTSGRYPLGRSFLFITRGHPSAAAQHFIDFALGDTGQSLVAHAGYIPVGR